MFILKTIGTDKVPDYIQIRDDEFKLLDLVKFSVFEKNIRNMYKTDAEEIIEKVKSADYGKLIQIDKVWKK